MISDNIFNILMVWPGKGMRSIYMELSSGKTCKSENDNNGLYGWSCK